jgi:hypothetical protein
MSISKAETALTTRIASLAAEADVEQTKTLAEALSTIKYGPQGWTGKTEYHSENVNDNRNTFPGGKRGEAGFR